MTPWPRRVHTRKNRRADPAARRRITTPPDRARPAAEPLVEVSDKGRRSHSQRARATLGASLEDRAFCGRDHYRLAKRRGHQTSRRRASLAYGLKTANARKRAIFSRRSTDGSRRDLVRPTSERLRRCSKRSGEASLSRLGLRLAQTFGGRFDPFANPPANDRCCAQLSFPRCVLPVARRHPHARRCVRKV